MEGGVGWAASLLGDLAGHWEKHNPRVLERFDPARLDNDLMQRLFREHGSYRQGLAQMRTDERSQLLWGAREDSAANDEWSRCGIEKVTDIRDLFVPKFYFGCEGDDRMTALAFDRGKNAFGARLNAIYSSDLGHWDLPAMRDAAAEAWELAEHGLITNDDFRDLVFANPVRAKAEVNPDFFKGTVVEDAARELMEGVGGISSK